MTSKLSHDEKIAAMTFSSVYPHYVNKVEKNARMKLHQVITWLTGYSPAKIEEHIERMSTFKEFFEGATLNQNAPLITEQFVDTELRKLKILLPKEFVILIS